MGFPPRWGRESMVVGGTRLELMTSSVSGKRATNCANRPRWRRDLNPCTRICSPLPRLSATPPGKSTRPAGGFRPSPSGRRDSNPRPSPWQGDALPAEPRPRACRATGAVRGVEHHIRIVRRFAKRTRAPVGSAHDFAHRRGFGYRVPPRAIGAVGSALRSHRRGHQFKSGIAHRDENPPRVHPGRVFSFPGPPAVQPRANTSPLATA